MRTMLLGLNLVWLLAAQVVTGLLLLTQQTLGPMNEGLMIPLFFGLNLPALVLQPPRGSFRALGTPLFIIGMAVIMVNFMRAGMMSQGFKTLDGVLHILTAQSLWLAFPAYWAARNQAA